MAYPVRLFLLVTALATTTTQASVDRLTALGDLNQALLDDSNSFIYPASLSEWPRFAVELYDDWAGVAYPLSSRHSLGLFFNRPTAEIADLAAYVQDSGSDLFRALNPNPWFDLAYNFAPRANLVLGIAAALAYDRSTIESRLASTTLLDIRLGARLGVRRILDIGLGVRNYRLRDQTLAGVEYAQTDGAGFNLDLRYRWPIGERLLLLPYLSLGREAYALAPQEHTRTYMHLGAGVQLTPARGVLVIAALDTGLERSKLAQSDAPLADDHRFHLPTWILGGEARVGAMVLRLGMRHQSQWDDRERLHTGQWIESSAFATSLTTHLGLGFEFAALQLDGLLERDFLRDGPHFLGGSRHGGGILSHLSLTYRFEPPGR